MVVTMNFLTRSLVLMTALVLLSGCALFSLNKDNTFSKDSCLITGKIHSVEAVKKPILVVAYAEVDGKFKVAHYAVLHAPGAFELLVPKGRYRLLAFEDTNQNLILDQGEAAGVPFNAVSLEEYPINAPGGGLVYDVLIVLSKKTDLSRRVPVDVLAGNFAGNFNWHSTQAGSIMNINEPAFSAEEGANGFWLPFEFFLKHGANVYFLEPYDAKRTPVLLVHGAAGSPQDWRYFIDKIDRTRYQVWIYYYPSGARLKSMADLLSTKISELHRQYHFERLYITAHSMGGLVARYALANNTDHLYYSKLFISISSPFGGEKLAGTGVEKSPAVIPSWKDMTPDSEFIRKMFATRIPPTTKTYLFFGHKGNRNPLRGNNDSAVTLESMLDPRAQKEALKVFAFNEDHVSILNSPDVFAQYSLILDEADKGDDVLAGAKKKGNFRFQYTVKKQSNVPPLWMWLFFLPLEKDRPSFAIPVDPLNADRDTPLAEGNYDVGLLSWGYKSTPSKVGINVGKGKTAYVNLSLEPQGMAGGQVVEERKSEDAYWGFMPALSVQDRIRSITLTGNGMTRKILPPGITPEQSVQAVMNNRDYFYRDTFIFVDLPKGSYKLEMDIAGCSPVIRDIDVDPQMIAQAMKIKICPHLEKEPGR